MFKDIADMTPAELAVADQVHESAKDAIAAIRRIVRELAEENSDWNSLELSYCLSQSLSEQYSVKDLSIMLATSVVEDRRQA